MRSLSFSSRRGADRVPEPLVKIARSAVVRYRHVGLTRRDVMVAAYPKAGSTWLRFVLASALAGADVDFDSVRQISPPLGAHRGSYGILPLGGRLVKTHDLPRFIGPARPPRVLYLLRDGRDVGISYYHHFTRRGFYTGDLPDFLELFLAGRVGPFGSWQAHANEWRAFLARTSQPGALIRYEDMLLDPVATLLSASSQLELGLDEAAVTRALDAHTTERMRAKESASVWLSGHTKAAGIPFVRVGRAGGWRDVLDEATVARFTSAAGPELREGGYETGGPVVSLLA